MVDYDSIFSNFYRTHKNRKREENDEDESAEND